MPFHLHGLPVCVTNLITMKKLVTITFGLLATLFLFAYVAEKPTYFIAEEITFKGQVLDSSGEPLIGASILLAGTTCGTVTDIDGNYRLTCSYTESKHPLKLICNYTGFSTLEKEVEIGDETEIKVDFQLEEGVSLDEVVVTGLGITRAKKDISYASSSSRRISKGKKSKKSTAAPADRRGRSDYSVASPAPSSTSTRIEKEASTYSSDFVAPSPVAEEAEADYSYETPASIEVHSAKKLSATSEASKPSAPKAKKRVEKTEKKDKATAPSPSPSAPVRRAGTLTAGEVHDFSKWELWQDVAGEDLNEYVATWNFNLTQRYTVQVLTEDGFPVVDAKVELLDKNKNLWTARTDNTGKAELWANVFREDAKQLENLKAQVSYKGRTQIIEKLTPFQEGINFLRLVEGCKMPKTMDVLFVVDATSSMADELSYIQAELYDVIQRVQELRKETTINLGSVFYRDRGDAYITRKSDLSSNISQTANFIKKQNAQGGGDYPEAMDQAFTVAIEEMKWSENSIGRFMFVILDAPPHHSLSLIHI